jgi:hypothetical protein
MAPGDTTVGSRPTTQPCVAGWRSSAGGAFLAPTAAARAQSWSLVTHRRSERARPEPGGPAPMTQMLAGNRAEGWWLVRTVSGSHGAHAPAPSSSPRQRVASLPEVVPDGEAALDQDWATLRRLVQRRKTGARWRRQR